MTNKEILKKKIIYRSIHRGNKEMDLLLGNFVKKYIDDFNYNDLLSLEKLILQEDELIYDLYFKKKNNSCFTDIKILPIFKNFKL